MSGGVLKLIALILMTVDHIGEFFPNTPIWFRYIGRLSAPIFFFIAAEGIYHTRNRINYLKRLYIASIIMAVAACVFSLFGGNFITNNIFASILHGTVLVYICEEYRENKLKRDKLLIIYVVWQIISAFICAFINNANIPLGYNVTRIIFTVLGNYSFSAEGSFYLTFAIFIFYLCRDSKKKLAVVYTLYCALFFALTVLKIPTYTYSLLCHIGLSPDIAQIITGASFYELIFEKYYQWMMIFSLPFMLLYNGKKGRYPKMLFYIYYPAHLFIIAGLAMIIK